jgi:hypothetical protein
VDTSFYLEIDQQAPAMYVLGLLLPWPDGLLSLQAGEARKSVISDQSGLIGAH